MRLQTRVVLIVSISTAVAILLVNVILASSLSSKDIADAKRDAYQQARLIKSGLLAVMMTAGDSEKIAQALADMSADKNIEFRMIRSEQVIRQHGIKRGEVARDDLERRALDTGETLEVMDGDNQFRLIFPFVTDERCGNCHLDMNDDPVKPGMVNGAVAVIFDLSERRKESHKVILRIIFSLTFAMLLLAVLILWMTYRDITGPIQAIVQGLTRLKDGRFTIDLPKYGTHEIEIMAEVVRATATDLALQKKTRDRELAESRKQVKAVERLIREKAQAMGLGDGDGADALLHRLGSALDSAEWAALIQEGLGYVEQSDSKVVLPSDPAVIPAVAIFLSSKMQGASGGVIARSIELAIEEGLANAIYHGNLEIDSPVSEMEVDEMNLLVAERNSKLPYMERKVTIESFICSDSARFTIIDEGPGFDWRNMLNRHEEDTDTVFGRGIGIMRTLASRVKYNEIGNRLTLEFDIEKSSAHNKPTDS